MKYLSIPLFLLMWGCTSPISTIERTIDNVIRYDTIKVTLPQDVRYDTVWLNNGEGESIKYIVKVDTHRVFIKGKEKIVYVPVVDTVTVTRTEIKTVESDDLSTKEMFYYAFGLVGMILLITVLRK